MIETSSINCSVAISINENIVSCIEQQEQNIHAGSITLFIEQALNEANIPLQELDAIAVGAGPGSYTGLRIGVSTAKGLCYALDKPLIACNSLYTLFAYAKSIHPEQLQVIPLIDARRMEVYTCTYNYDGALLEDTRAVIVNEETFREPLQKNKTVMLGDGLTKVQDMYADLENLIPINNAYPSAQYMQEEAIHKFKRKQFENVAYFEPFYLKEFYFNK